MRFLFLILFLINNYEYQLDPIVADCDLKYGCCCWEFCPILRIPYEVRDSLQLPNIFSGNLVDGACSTSKYIPLGVIWENDARDTSYLVIKYKLNKKRGYKVYWFIKSYE